MQGLRAALVALVLLASGRAIAQTAPAESETEPVADADAEPHAEPVAEAEPVADAEPVVETVRVHVLPLRPGVEAHVRLGSHTVTNDTTSHVEDDYTILCPSPPCDADVPTGVHLFAVAGTGGDPLPVRELDLTPGVEHTLRIDLDDRSAIRTAGTLTALLVGAPGLVVLLVSLIGPAVDRSRFDAIFIGIGAPLTAIGIAAIPFAAWGDTRVVELEPPEDEPAPTP